MVIQTGRYLNTPENPFESRKTEEKFGGKRMEQKVKDE
jgi:hypothetical protein